MTSKHFRKIGFFFISALLLAGAVVALTADGLFAPTIDPRYADKIGSKEYPRFELITHYELNERPGTLVVWSPEGNTFIQASLTRMYTMWSKEGKLLKENTAHVDSGVAITPDGKHFISGSAHRDGRGNLSIVDLQSHVVTKVIDGPEEGAALELMLSRSGDLLIASYTNGKIYVFDSITWAILGTFETDQPTNNKIAVSPDDTHFAAGSQKGSIFIWNYRTGELVKHFRAHTGPIESLTYSASGKTLITGATSSRSLRDPKSGKMVLLSDPDLVRIWSATDWRKTLGITEGMKKHMKIHALAIHPDSTLIAVSGISREFLRVYDARNGHTVQDLPVDFVVKSAAFDPSGQYLAAVTDRSVFLWQLHSAGN